MFQRLFAALALAATLAACASTPNPIDSATRQGAFVKDATINWVMEDTRQQQNANYAASKTDIIARLERAVEARFAASPAGSVPVTFRIDVKNYSRANAAVGQLIGVPNALVADVTVLRESDGAELGVYKDVMGLYQGGGGLIGLAVQAASRPDVPQVMVDTFATNLRARFDSQ